MKSQALKKHTNAAVIKAGIRAGLWVKRAGKVSLADRYLPRRPVRHPTGIAAIDIAIGGGLIREGIVLVHGKAGVGKTTFVKGLGWPTLTNPASITKIEDFLQTITTPHAVIDGIYYLAARVQKEELIKVLRASKKTIFLIARATPAITPFEVDAVINIRTASDRTQAEQLARERYGQSVLRVETTKNRFGELGVFYAGIQNAEFTIMTRPRWEIMSPDAIMRALTPELLAGEPLEKQLAGLIVDSRNKSESERVKAGLSLLRATVAVLPKNVTWL